jgi:hypothetical protein
MQSVDRFQRLVYRGAWPASDEIAERAVLIIDFFAGRLRRRACVLWENRFEPLRRIGCEFLQGALAEGFRRRFTQAAQAAAETM